MGDHRRQVDAPFVDQPEWMAHIRRVKIVEVEAAAQMLNELVEALETGAESEIVLSLNGVPQARLLPALPREEVGENP